MYYILYNYYRAILSCFGVVFVLTTSSYGYFHVLNVAKMSEENQAAAITNIQPRVIGADGSESTQGGVFRQTIYDNAYVDEVGEAVAGAKLLELESIIVEWREKAESFIEENATLLEQNQELKTILERNIQMCDASQSTLTIGALQDLNLSYSSTEFVGADGSSRILTIMRTEDYSENTVLFSESLSDSDNLIKSNLKQAGGIKAAGVYNRNNFLKYVIEQKGTKTFASYASSDIAKKGLVKLGFVYDENYCLPAPLNLF